MNINSNINHRIVICYVSSGAIVFIPGNMCRSRFFRVNIDCTQTNGIFLSISARLRVHDIFNFCVCSKYGKCIAWKYCHSSSCPSIVFPLLNFPVTKYFFRITSFRSGSCRCQRTIYISMSICRCSCTTVSIIFNDNTGRSFKRSTPLRIDIQFLSDPETITSLISSRIRIGYRINQVTVDIVGICHIDSFVIRCSNITFINGICITVKYPGACLIKIPANKFISGQSSGRLTYMSAFTDTEVQLLSRRSPVDVTGCAFRIIRMQEHTVLFPTPLSIYCYTTFGHCSKGVWLCA